MLEGKFKFFRQEKQLLKMGPIALVRSSYFFVILGVLLTAVQLGMLFAGKDLITEKLGLWSSMPLLVVLAILSGLLFCIQIKLPGKVGFIIASLIYGCMPFVAFYMVEYINGAYAFGFESKFIFMNVVVYILGYLLLLIVFGNYRWSAMLGTLVFYAFAVACYFIMIFRGTPFVPLDILSAGTGLNVADHYVLELSAPLLIGTICGIFLLAVGFQLGNGNLVRTRWKLGLRLIALAGCFCLVSAFFSQNYLSKNGYTICYWDQKISYDQLGDGLAFSVNLRNVFPEKPSNYSAENVRNIVDEKLDADGIDPKGDGAYNMLTGKADYKPGDKKPNIIVVMNESFADLETCGDLQTNIDVLPFFNSLKENTVRGGLQVSTYGGGTACTEYEVLTGNAQRFLQAGAVAYSASIRDTTPSMPWTLHEQGYQTQAFHPYYRSGWSREKAYDYLGFEKFISLEDILPPEMITMSAEDRMEAVEKDFDPKDGDVYNRDYMSDHYDFKLIEKYLSEKRKDTPFFMFNVTIQNHGGYGYPCPNFDEEVVIENMSQDYPQAQRYLSLMHSSDKAFEELITYFKKRPEEPTVVVMFGDHFPALEDEFYAELFGKPSDQYTPEERLRTFQTPFVIWANYDIPEKDIGAISSNYFSTLIMETAGLPLPDYNRYLASLYKEVPVISTVGFMDSKGNVASELDKKAPYAAAVNDYQCVVFNNLLDTRHRDWSIFTPDKEPLPKIDTEDDK